ncbi:MAG: protein translocase subunit SecD, partial [Planctomycetaceae bacterium]
QIKRQITRIGSLEFAILATRASNRHQQIIDRAQRLPENQRDLFNDENLIIASWRDVAEGESIESIGGGGGVVTRTVIRDGEPVEQFLIVLDEDQRQRVTGQYLTRAYQTQDPNGGLAVGFTFNQQGGRLFGQLTGRHQVQEGQTQYRLAILLDNNVVSAPSLRETIRDSGIITGNFTRAEIDDLVNVLNAGALEVPLQEEPESEFSISPTLGEDVREKGVTAIFVAGGLVVLFMIAYYFLAGVIADLCLVLNMLLILGAMAFIDAAYTLPGLAGIVLTIGMAVDANVLIFERIREEQERGSSLRMAIHNGFGRALSAIIDSNVTTLITAVILYMIGTDQVRGFAVTLFIGLVASMFTAVFFGRLVFDILERRRWVRHISMMHLFKVPPIDWVGKQIPAVILSVVVLGGGLIAFVVRGDDNLDIDFTGGTMLTFEFEEPQNTDEIRALLRKEFDASVTLEPLQLATTAPAAGAIDFDEAKQFRMRTKNQDLDEVREQVNDALTGSGRELLIIELTEYEVQPIPEATDGTQAAEALPPELRERFAGGHRVVMEFSEPISPSAVRDNFAVELGNIPIGPEEDAPSKYENPQEMVQAIALGTGDAEQGDDASGTGRSTRMQLLVTLEVAQADLQQSLSTLQATMAENPVFSEVNRFESSVADEIKQQALLAIFFSIVAVIAYLWFRFTRVTFGIAAVVAVVHDVVFTMGMLAVGSYLSETFIGPWLLLEDFKINMAMVAAFLTIVGYSLNDTIVIFDRVREVRGKNPALTAGMVNRAVNQTLSRTILTTLTVFMVVIVLYLFGGEGIHGFAFALVVGLLSGTYSTLFIA